MGKNTMFFGGVPIGPDLKRLNETFPSLREGQIIPNEELERVIGEERRSSRFRTVLTGWRRQLQRDRNVVMRAVPTVGQRVLSQWERVGDAAQRHRRGAKQILVAGTDMSMVETGDFDDLQKQKHEQLVRAIAASGLTVRTEQRAIATFLRAPAQLPRKVGLAEHG